MKPRLLWLIVALSSIWLAVILISVLAPDMYSQWDGTFPIAAATTWFFGAIATGAVIKEIARRRSPKKVYIGIAIVTTIIWLAAIPVSIFVPLLVNSWDKSEFPLAAILAPLAAAAVTGLAGNIIRPLMEIDWGAEDDEAVAEDGKPSSD